MTNKKKTGLGRGLDSLIPILADDDETEDRSSLTLEDMLKDKDDDQEDDESQLSKEKKTKKPSKPKKAAKKKKKTTKTTEKPDIKEEKTISKETTPETPDLEPTNVEKATSDPDESQINKGTDQSISEDAKTSDLENVKTSEIDNVKTSDVDNEKVPDSANEKTSEIQVEDSEVKDEVKADEVKDEVKADEVKDEVKADDVAENTETEAETKEESEKTLEDIKDNLSEREKQSIEEVIKIIAKNPRITLWSAKSAAVFRYLRKTEPEFSISKEASKLIDEAVQTKYPEIWVLFKDIEK